MIDSSPARVSSPKMTSSTLPSLSGTRTEVRIPPNVIKSTSTPLWFFKVILKNKAGNRTFYRLSWC